LFDSGWNRLLLCVVGIEYYYKSWSFLLGKLVVKDPKVALVNLTKVPFWTSQFWHCLFWLMALLTKPIGANLTGQLDLWSIWIMVYMTRGLFDQ
jgi:hypothetical protein